MARRAASRRARPIRVQKFTLELMKRQIHLCSDLGRSVGEIQQLERRSQMFRSVGENELATCSLLDLSPHSDKPPGTISFKGTR
jgi:hypothetical protein